MNNLDVILNKALMLGSSMALDCHNSDVIEKQLIIISNTILDLHHIKGELAPTLKKLDEEIARIDAIRLTKGVVGVGLILLGQNAEMLNADTKLYIDSYTNSKKPKLVNIRSSPQTNEHN